MARTLYLFKKCKPNLGNNTHYFGTGAQLRALLAANPASYVGTFTENSYRIETGHVKLQAQLSNYNAITYIIDEDTETGYFKAYHVMNNSVVGGYVDFSVQVDLWGSNIFLAEFSKMHAIRCNRNIGGGWYDDIKTSVIDPNNYLEPAIYPSLTIDRQTAQSTFWVFFLAECVISQNLIGTEAITETKLYALSLAEVYGLAASVRKGYKPVEVAAALISGIYKFNYSSPRDYAINVKQIFIAPLSVVPRLSDSVTSSSWLGELNVNVYVVDAFITPNLYLNQGISSIDPDYEYYIGAGLNVRPLRRVIDAADNYTQIIYKVAADGLKVTLRQGSHDDDITDAFILPLTSNAKIDDALTKISFAINFGLRTYANARQIFESDAKKRDIYGGVSDLIGQFTSALGNGGASPSGLNAQGDATTTFGWTIPNAEQTSEDITNISNPYTIFKFKSLKNENEHARINGANFDKFVTSFADVASCSLLGTGTLTDTYIVLDSVEVEGVQEEAEQFIKGELSRGVYYVVL